MAERNKGIQADIDAARNVLAALAKPEDKRLQEEHLQEIQAIMQELEDTRHRTGAVVYGTGPHKAVVLPALVNGVFVVVTEEGFKAIRPDDDWQDHKREGSIRHIVSVLTDARTKRDGIVPDSPELENWYAPNIGYFSPFNCGSSILS